MRTTHRPIWKREEWLVIDERTGQTHYASEMVREPDTGLLVHRDSVDPKHPLLKLRPKHKDPTPVQPVIPSPEVLPQDLVNFATDLGGLIGQSGIQRCEPAASEHIFGTGVGKMVIEGCNEFARFTVDAKDRTAGPFFDDQFP